MLYVRVLESVFWRFSLRRALLVVERGEQSVRVGTHPPRVLSAPLPPPSRDSRRAMAHGAGAGSAARVISAKDLNDPSADRPAKSAKLERHLRDAFTSRDLFGVVRGACDNPSCPGCVGGYLKATSEYTKRAEETNRPHPHNDPSLTNCTRCGCAASAHEVSVGDDAREKGNDAFVLCDFESALREYSRAIAAKPGDARGYSNRAAVRRVRLSLVPWFQDFIFDRERLL
jgi:hypothetical protein